MLSHEPNHLLFIEPRKSPARKPLVDALTRRMVAAFRLATKAAVYRGFHFCSCAARSGNCDFTLPNGMLTNSLCIHYLAHHRAEVPADQLAIIEAFPHGEAEPSEQDLSGA